MQRISYGEFHIDNEEIALNPKMKKFWFEKLNHPPSESIYLPKYGMTLPYVFKGRILWMEEISDVLKKK
ncbi:hypothetical protein [Aquiflexum sp.]|uniref:hypothetical protein n=1 Tax=Aquiflexum sp. TaxID=1872584 RepID=UPI00359449CA